MSAASELSPAGAAAWRRALSRHVRESDGRRQLLYSRGRKAVVASYLESRARRAVPPLLREYAEKLVGAILAFWLIGALLSLAHAPPIYTFAAFGLFYSLQTAYHTYRLALDPDYRIPKCRCAGSRNDHSEAVLGSREGFAGKVPKGLLGAALYLALLGLARSGHGQAALLLAAGAVAANAYLAYIMVARIRALCAACVNLAALNVLILWQLLR